MAPGGGSLAGRDGQTGPGNAEGAVKTSMSHGDEDNRACAMQAEDAQRQSISAALIGRNYSNFIGCEITNYSGQIITPCLPIFKYSFSD